MSDTIADLQRLVVDFSTSRGWPNDPKDLAMSTAIEAAEVMLVYRGKSEGEHLTYAEYINLCLECADTLWFLLRLCDKMHIDLAQALRDKMAINAQRFQLKGAHGA